MAYPAVIGTPGYSEETADTTTHDVVLPTGIQAGERLLLFAVIDGNTTTALTGMPSGWTQVLHLNGSPTITLAVWEKIGASGSEANFTYTTSVSERSANRTYRITNAHASSAMEVSSGGPNGGGATTVNFPSLGPSWGLADNLYIAFCGIDGSVTISAWPADLPDDQFTDNTGSGTNGAGIGIAMVSEHTSFHDGGTATISASSGAIGKTLAIRPAAVISTYGKAPETDTALPYTAELFASRRLNERGGWVSPHSRPVDERGRRVHGKTDEYGNRVFGFAAAAQQALYGRSSEDDAALSFAASKTVFYGVATELDMGAGFFSASKLASYGTAQEVDAAFPFGVESKVVLYGPAVESDEALPYEATVPIFREWFETTNVNQLRHRRRRRGEIYAPGKGWTVP